MTATSSEDAPDLLVVAFEFVAERGWSGFRLTELAERTGKSPSELYDEVRSPYQLLARLGRRLDRAMLEIDPKELAELSVRERLFELVMRRFDAMTPFRAGLRRLGRDAPRHPVALLALCCNLDRMAAWILDVAGVERRGLGRRCARRALAGVYARVFQVWVRDETPDRSRTLAELDKRLQQLERLAKFAEGFRGARPTAAAAPG